MLIAITPLYGRGDLAEMLEAEQAQIEETVADLSEEQLRWRPNPRAKSALDILWHLAYDRETRSPRPAGKAEALANLRADYAALLALIRTPAKLEETLTWWNGEQVNRRAIVLGAIRHRAYHLGELVYLRQAQGLDEPRYYHET